MKNGSLSDTIGRPLLQAGAALLLLAATGCGWVRVPADQTAAAPAPVDLRSAGPESPPASDRSFGAERGDVGSARAAPRANVESETLPPISGPLEPMPAPRSSRADPPTTVARSEPPPSSARPTAAKPVALAAKPAELPAKAKAEAADPPAKAKAGRGFLKPVEGTVLSGYGAKSSGTHNDGINIAARRGTPVRAAQDGTVAYAGNELPGFGNLVLVKHPDGWVTAYGHTDEILVSKGQAVKRGQTIAKVGSTGNVTQPQLHFEIRNGSRAVDPTPFLADAEGPARGSQLSSQLAQGR